MTLLLQELLGKFNQHITFFLVFPLIFFLGLYLSIRLKFLQLFKLKLGMSFIFKKEEGATGSMSRYEAVASVLASNFGTGNISGMAVALTLGGPGACVWMWIVALFAAIIQYASCLLGVKYRRKNEQGEYVGGPMYYLREGLGLKKTAWAFSFCVILAAFAVGNFAQVNSITIPLKALSIPGWVSGWILAALIGCVLIGGAKRISRVFSTLVPFMALLYFGTALIILVLYHDQLGSAFSLMFKSAFGVRELAGGLLGAGMVKALTTGFGRAIFATDAASGLVPLLQSGAKSNQPVIDGAVSLVAPLLVMMVCTTTTLVLIVTGAFTGGLESTNMVTFAYCKGLSSNIGFYIVIISLLLFGFTTALAWASCMQKAVHFLWGRSYVKPLVWLYILLVPIGALMQVKMVWALADIALSFMVLTNLIAVCGLSKEVIYDSRLFFSREKEPLLGKEQM